MLLGPLQEGVGWLWGCHAFLLISVLRGSGFIRLAKFQGLAGCCNLRPWFGTFVHSVLLTDASSPRHPLSLCGLTCGKVRPQGVGVPRGPALWPHPSTLHGPGWCLLLGVQTGHPLLLAFPAASLVCLPRDGLRTFSLVLIPAATKN